MRNAKRHPNIIYGAVAITALLASVACNSTADTPSQDTATKTQTASRFTTLGTAGGPVIYLERSQPANLLEVNGTPYVIDAGSGTVERLEAAGYTPSEIHTVFISHLHADHYAGLYPLLSLRWMLKAQEPLTIYGPPGTDALVAGMVASLEPQAQIGFGLGNKDAAPADTVRVVIIKSGEDIAFDDFRFRTVANSHFSGIDSARPGAPMSLSFRFDLAERSIGYTGDSGPSQAMVELFSDVDVLVSEVIDLDRVVASIKVRHPHMPDEAVLQLASHLASQHLTTAAVGELARDARAGKLVLTHLALDGSTESAEARLLSEIGAIYDGPVHVSRDMDTF